MRTRTSPLRSLAAILGVWLVLASVLALRHQAQVGHVDDPRTGLARHADAHVAGHRASGDAHVHAASGGEGDDDVCAILTALHRAARAIERPAIALAAPAITERSQPPAPPFAPAAAAIIRYAPKTSPPAHG